MTSGQAVSSGISKVKAKPVCVVNHKKDSKNFAVLVNSMEEFFNAAVNAGETIYKTDVDNLYDLYLDSFEDGGDRQFRRCSCCKQFIERYGNLAIVRDNKLQSAIWVDGDYKDYSDAVTSMRRAVERSKIDTIYLNTSRKWGTKQAGNSLDGTPFTHFFIQPSSAFKLRTEDVANRLVAEKREHFNTLARALAEFSEVHVKKALTLLASGTLDRPEKVKPGLNFILECLQIPKSANYRNILWSKVATAPPGFCTPRSGMIGTLIDYIRDGDSNENIAIKFNKLMDPLKYMRPQALPSAGNIAQAEKLIEKLGLENSLRRRHARFEEVPKIWEYSDKKSSDTAKTGIFSSVKAKNKEPVLDVPDSGPYKNITWVKFARDVLPEAQKIELFFNNGVYYSFFGLTTAVDLDAPPILQWDHETHRNPFSKYTYATPVNPSVWGLRHSDWYNVDGICMTPEKMNGGSPNHEDGVIFLIKQAKNSHKVNLALFPECLKGELHGIRATIEAYNKTKLLEGYEEASANGLFIGNENRANKIRVTTKIGANFYVIDRWD